MTETDSVSYGLKEINFKFFFIHPDYLLEKTTMAKENFRWATEVLIGVEKTDSGYMVTTTSTIELTDAKMKGKIIGKLVTESVFEIHGKPSFKLKEILFQQFQNMNTSHALGGWLAKVENPFFYSVVPCTYNDILPGNLDIQRQIFEEWDF